MEPGERVIVSQISLANAGELTLPAGGARRVPVHRND